MTSRPIRLVAVDDDPSALSILRALVPEGIAVETYLTGNACLDAVQTAPPDIAILDLNLPDIGGIELLLQVRAVDPSIEVILLTADYSTDAAVAAIKAGASDYLTKPVQISRFRETLGRSVQAICSHRELQVAENDLATKYSFEGMVGRSLAMRGIFDMVRRIGPHFRAALVTGPSGTGKELVARALHAYSSCRSGPLIVCNCAAIPDSLMEAELFGRVKGAYTGAVGESAGYFGRAAGGTLMLDEFADLPLTAQAALLRAVQFGDVQRLGAGSPVHVDVRIVACTNRDLRAAVRDRTFREDLFFRLGTFELSIPPLSQRREDIPLLIRHFLNRSRREIHKDLSGLTAAAEALLLAYSWPGNIRELEQAIHYGAVMANSPWIGIVDLPAYLRTPQAAEIRERALRTTSRAEAQSRHVLDVLSQTGGDKHQAARLLGVSRATLYRLLKSARNAPM
ncbi:MAG TPA: sigma-54 dependent transcriptional regulator [Bryobacteraceae bacterium]|nr:sigma-54 dependent transcriptional regulator [Bryobacteraceae bacterium]